MYTIDEQELIQAAKTKCERTRAEVPLTLNRTHYIYWPRRRQVKETIFMVYNYAAQGIPYTDPETEQTMRAGEGVYLSIKTSNIQELHEKNDNRYLNRGR